MKNLIMNHKKLVTTCLFCALVVCLLTATFLGASAFAAPDNTANVLSEADDVSVLADDDSDETAGVATQSDAVSKQYTFTTTDGGTVFYQKYNQVGFAICSIRLNFVAGTTDDAYFELQFDFYDFFENDTESVDYTLTVDGCGHESFEFVNMSEGLQTRKIPLSTFNLPSSNFAKTVHFIVGMEEGQGSGFIINEDVGTLSCVTAQPLPVTPTKTGYTFTGWYTDEACTQLYEQEYITGNVTLYAGWRANTYTIAFNGNGKSSGTMANLGMTYDTAANLTANAFKRSGYVFKGWSTSATEAVVYADEASVKNLTAVDDATVTLYAVWEQVSYTVHFNANGGEGNMNDQTHTIDVAKKLTNNGFTRTGYTFKGWAMSASGNVSYTNMQSVTNIGSAGATVQLYAVWEINKLTIKYNANEGAGSIANQTINYGESATLTLVSGHIQREYYSFKGWATEQGGAVVYKDGASISNTNTANSTITLYAVWEPIMCTVTFIVDGEIFTIVTVTAGTRTSEVIGQAVNTVMYEVDGQVLPN